MLRWLFLVAGAFGFVLMISFGTQVAIFTSFGALFGNFATFCLQYNGAMDRAQARITGQIAQLQPNSDVRQRLETTAVKPTSEDRVHPKDLLSLLNLLTGVACACYFVFGCYLWIR